MTTLQYIGFSILASPFVVLTYFMARDIGVLGAVAVWGGVLGIVACVYLGLGLAAGLIK